MLSLESDCSQYYGDCTVGLDDDVLRLGIIQKRQMIVVTGCVFYPV